MQQVEAYIQNATAYIADPLRAAEAQKELRAHFTEVMAELTEQGIDSYTAEAVAITRMGSARAMAIPLAEAHHRHLPWRHYLAILPLSCMIAVPLIWRGQYFDWWRVDQRWLPVLIFCLCPSPEVLRRFWRLLVVDVQAKFHWVQGQPLRPALVSGGVAGFAAGLVFTPAFGAFQSLSDVLVLLSPLVALLVLWVLRRWWRGQPVMTAAFASVGFPLGFMWIGARPYSHDWPVVVGLFTVLFALLAFAVGWVAQVIGRKGWLDRLKSES